MKWILILCCLVNIDRMAPKKTTTSLAPAMTQAVIRQLVADSVAAALEAQAANMTNNDNTNRNNGPVETPAARKCTYKEFISCQPFYFDGTEGAVGFIRWFERTELVFSHSNCTEDCKVKFLLNVFIEGLPQSIDETVSASKPQTLEEAIKIAQRLLNHVLKHGSVQRTNDHKQKFNDRRNTTNNINNNYPNNRDNNNYPNDRNNHYHQQQNKRQETVKAYAATST
nr:hypothetical protein [Tanacetum cinerariifolium]GEZ69125.1 hypothetical protein [Tanacetum cinerariifolium]